MVKNIFRLVHSVIIIGIIFNLVTNQYCSPLIFGAQLALTLLRAIMENNFINRHSKVQLLATLVLSYALFPNRARFLSWIFLIKGVEVHQCLKAVRKELFTTNKYIAFIFDVLRFTICQYIFLGGVMLLYRFLAECPIDPIPQTHVVMYQLAVTASTIGYGDITPKSKNQMIFFTFAIPIICSSFVVYTNSLVEVYTDTFLKEEETTLEEETVKAA